MMEGQTNLPSAQVVIVEDDRDVRETLVEVLLEEGYRARAFSDGLSALAVLAQMVPPPQLILLDLLMPGMDGWAFRQAQQQTPAVADVATVILSADQAGELDSLHAAEYLRKPIHMHTLIDLVQRYCGPARH